MGLAREGLKRFDHGAEIYIRPMYWAEEGAPGGVRPDPESTRWCLSLYVAPFPKPTGTAITLSPFRRPTRESALVDAKAGSLYPNNARALIEARGRGFDNCLLRDMLGNIAELGTANIFMVKDGVVFTPAPNGTFLAGITRGRVIALLRASDARWSRRCCAIPISSRPTRFFPPATTPKWRRSRASMSGICSRARLPPGPRAILGICARGRLLTARAGYLGN